MERLVADDLFAGAGGWDIAAAALGIHARGVENMPAARATRDAAGLTTSHDDVWTFVPDGQASGLIASPPCQTFSMAGKGAGRKALDDVLDIINRFAFLDLDELRKMGEKVGDERTALVLTPLHFALSGHGYRWLAWEQVPTVLPVWQACAEVLCGAGWSAWAGLLHAEQYGVPQTRKRAFLLASLDREVRPPTPTHSRYHSRSPERLDPGVLPWVSMAEALGWDGDGEVVSNYGTGGDPQNRGRRSFAEPAATVTEKVGRNRVEWQLATGTRPNAATRRLDEPAPAFAFGHDAASYVWSPAGMTPEEIVERKKGHPDWCYRRPSTTIVGTFKPEVVAAPGYRTTVSRQNAPDSVRVTVEEAATLQSFPPMPWQGAKGKQYLQVGNAVPPLLALHALGAVAR